jgi:PKD repeat protein
MLRNAFIALCVLLLPTLAEALEITSAPGGGNWSNPNTWNELIVPTAGDNVTIVSLVTVNTLSSCDDITITAAGTVQGGTGTQTLFVGGTATNAGSIVNSVYNLVVKVVGDIYNSGTWSNHSTTCMAPADQHVGMDPGTVFEGDFILDGSAVGQLIADTALYFSNDVDLNDGTISLGVGASISSTGPVIKEATILCNGNDLTLGNNCYLTNTTVDHADLHGVVGIATGVTFSGAMSVVDTLQVRPVGSVILTVEDGLDNYGLVRNNVYNLSIEMDGDLNNQGDWTNYRTTLLGATDQTFSMGPSATFTSELILDDAAVGNLLAATPLRCGGGIDLNEGTLTLDPGASLEVNGNYFRDGSLIAAGGDFKMTDGAYLQAMVLDDAVLKGVVSVGANTVSLTGGCIVSDTLQVRPVGSYVLNVEDGLTNNGLIRNNVYNLSLSFSGNLTNNGDWQNYRTTCLGLADQHLSMSELATFTSELILDVDAVGDLLADTPLRIDNMIDLNGGSMILASGVSGLEVSGVEYVGDGNFMANGNDFGLMDGAYLATTTVDAAVLRGTVQVTTSVAFTGGTIVADTLQVRAVGSYTVSVDGDLTNNGTIRNNVYNLSFEIDNGDLINNGIWDNHHTTLMGSVDQNLSMSESAVFDSNLYFHADAVGQLYATTPYRMVGAFDLNGGTIDLLPGCSLDVEGGSVNDGTFHCNGNDFGLHDGSWISTAAIDEATLRGEFHILTNVAFSGGVIIEDTLSVRPVGTYTLMVDDLLINRGLVKNNTYSLIVQTTGSVVNEGVWENYMVRMDGPDDQYIGATDANPMDSPNFNLYSNLTSGGYQWYKDGSMLGGENSTVLSFNHIGDAEHGIYYCQDNSSAVSHDFIIVEGSLSAAFTADVTSGGAPLTVNFTYTGSNATSWSWDLDGDGIADSSDENPSWEYTDEGFYTVTLIASNEFGDIKEVKADYIEVTDATGVPTAPAYISLDQNFPNPFNPSTKIRFTLPDPGHVRLTTYDTNGRRIDVLTDEQWPAGSHVITWEPKEQASGVYFYKLQAGGREIIRKSVLIK